MAATKFEGVIEAVRYGDDQRIKLVRLYQRLGDTFSDYRLLNRDQLVKLLKDGKNVVAGHAIQYQASTFDVTTTVRLKQTAGGELLVSDLKPDMPRDWLEGVPFF
jgi:hypothetical protein